LENRSERNLIVATRHPSELDPITCSRVSAYSTTTPVNLVFCGYGEKNEISRKVILVHFFYTVFYIKKYIWLIVLAWNLQAVGIT